MLSNMKTITTQIEELETEITRCESRLDALERLCRLTSMTDERRQTLNQEKKALEQQVVDSRKRLKGLRWENWRSMLVSVILMAVVYLIFTFFYVPSNVKTAVQ